jgi:hypothetical protein
LARLACLAVLPARVSSRRLNSIAPQAHTGT